MARLTRRNFIKLAAASGAVIAAGGGLETEALAGTVKTQTGRDFSPTTRNSLEKEVILELLTINDR